MPSLQKPSLTSNAIKLIAILAMTLDHIAWAVWPGYPREFLPLLLHLIGRITCPIMCYFVAEGFHYTLGVKCTGITDTGVTYEDKDGVSHEIKAGSVVMAVGNKAKASEAAAMFNLGEKVLMVGDCVKAGSLQKAIRSAYAAANQL